MKILEKWINKINIVFQSWIFPASQPEKCMYTNMCIYKYKQVLDIYIYVCIYRFYIRNTYIYIYTQLLYIQYDLHSFVNRASTRWDDAPFPALFQSHLLISTTFTWLRCPVPLVGDMYPETKDWSFWYIKKMGVKSKKIGVHKYIYIYIHIYM